MKRTQQNVIAAPGTTGVNVYTDDDSKQIIICVDSTANPLVTTLDPIPYGGIASIQDFAAQKEVRQINLIGASTSKETIAASTKYKVRVTQLQQSYETKDRIDAVHAYTSPAVLSGTAATDRAQVYTALIAKINAYHKNYLTAYSLTRVDFTGGTSTADAATTFIIGETVTQETSTETARVAKCSITSGTMAGDDAAGVLWIFDRSADAPTWLETAKTLTAAGTVAGVSTNLVVTVTNATTVYNTGILTEDDASYFTSDLDRGGINSVYIENFATDTTEVSLAGKYSMGIGTDMLALKPVYSRDAQDLISGDPLMDFATDPVAGQTYTKIVLGLVGKNKDALGPQSETLPYQVIIYANDTTGANVTAFLANLVTAKAL